MIKKLLFTFLLTFCIAGAAHGTQLTMEDGSIGIGGLYVDVDLYAYDYHATTGAGEFSIQVGDYLTYGFCVDFSEGIEKTPGNTYEVENLTDPTVYTDGYFAAGTAEYAAWLMDTYSVGLGYTGYSSLVADSTEAEAAAAAQIAIWYALYELDGNPNTTFSFLSDGSASQDRIDSLVTLYLAELDNAIAASALGTSSQYFVAELYTTTYDQYGKPIYQDVQDLITTAPVPEPATMLLLGTGLLGLAGVRSRRKQTGKRQM